MKANMYHSHAGAAWWGVLLTSFTGALALSNAPHASHAARSGSVGRWAYAPGPRSLHVRMSVSGDLTERHLRVRTQCMCVCVHVCECVGGLRIHREMSVGGHAYV